MDVPKVFYTSRTHTQLRQLTSELLKTTFSKRTRSQGPSVNEAAEEEDTLPIRTVPLGGRAQLCINAKASNV